jgi:hypothetical protein
MSYESAASQLGHINLDKNTTGKRSAGKPHAAFDEAGTGNGRYNVPRQFSTLPVRGIEVPHKVEYCGTLDTERQEKQRTQIKPK